MVFKSVPSCFTLFVHVFPVFSSFFPVFPVFSSLFSRFCLPRHDELHRLIELLAAAGRQVRRQRDAGGAQGVEQSQVDGGRRSFP